jgi:hypothetical protein
MTAGPYLQTLCGTLAFCFAIQAASLRAVNGRTHKSESNFFSSVARLQTGIAPPPSVMLLGSSMTGRLPDRSNGFDGVANLGCDGGSAAPTLRAIARGDFPTPATLIVEANTLDRSGEEGEVDEAIRSGWFWAGVRVPLLGATARPSAFAYSAMFPRSRRLQGDRTALLTTAPSPRPWEAPVALTPTAEAAASKLASLINAAKQRGARVLVVQLPTRWQPGTEALAVARDVSRRTGSGYVDLTKALAEPEIAYTDGVHLDGPSATLCLRLILDSCAAMALPDR